MRAVGAERGYVAIENNKMDAVALFQDKLAGEDNIDLVALRTKYPQGGEKMLVKAILNREVPSEGIPLDVGVVVSNVGTAVAITECLTLNKPLIERVVTVSGSLVRKPANLLVPLGTPFAAFLEECDVDVDRSRPGHHGRSHDGYQSAHPPGSGGQGNHSHPGFEGRRDDGSS